MGTARIEIFRMGTKSDTHPGEIKAGPFQVEQITTSTTVTVAGSRPVVAGVSNYRDLHARITHDEVCFVAVGADPTADATGVGLGWRLAPNVPLIVPVIAGDKFSFDELA